MTTLVGRQRLGAGPDASPMPDFVDYRTDDIAGWLNEMLGEEVA